MSAAVRDEMRDAYPELEDHAARITKILDEEERRFTRTVEVGLKKLEEVTDRVNTAREKAKQQAVEKNAAVSGFNALLNGAEAFKLYDTYGLPRDFIEDVARDSGFEVDWEGFDHAMEEQRTRARASWKGAQQGSGQPPAY